MHEVFSLMQSAIQEYSILLFIRELKSRLFITRLTSASKLFKRQRILHLGKGAITMSNTPKRQGNYSRKKRLGIRVWYDLPSETRPEVEFRNEKVHSIIKVTNGFVVNTDKGPTLTSGLEDLLFDSKQPTDVL